MNNPDQPQPGNEGQAPQQPEVSQAPSAPQTPADAPASQVPQAPPAPQVPQAPQFGQPQAPQAPQYGQPQAPQYAPPQYGQPQAPQYAQPQYGQPQAPQYAQPQAPQYAQPQYAQGGYPAAYGEPGPGEPFDGATSPDDLTRPLYGATFGQAIKRFFRNYVNFKGRASRSEYWWIQLFIGLVYLIPLAIYFTGFGFVIGAESSSYDSSPYAPVDESMYNTGIGLVLAGVGFMLLIGLALFLPLLSIAWRRLHDANFAGPFYLLSLTSIGSIVVFVFLILGPKPEGRRFDQR